MKLILDRQNPFGLVITSVEQGTALDSVSIPMLVEWIKSDRVVVLRGFRPLNDEQLSGFCSGLGEVLEWDFGPINELRVQSDAKNYLYTNHEVPLHWDGAFVGRIPRYIFFQCEDASPGNGGETLFCDTVRLLKDADSREVNLWKQISIRYSTEKIAHYGGSFVSHLLSTHPVSGENTIRFAEPVKDLNPVSLDISGLPKQAVDGFLDDLGKRMRNPKYCYAHDWRTGDIVIADNHALLHGRRAFRQDAKRHLRRVNIL